MQRTRYRNLVLIIFMVFISSVAFAEKGDNTAPLSVGDQPAVLDTTSYFQGTWSGTWEAVSGHITGRDITIKVGSKNPDGTFDIEYSWGSGKDNKGRNIVPGAVKTKGREDGVKLVFEFSDPTNFKTTSIVMTKYEDVRAKAEMDYEVERGILKRVAYLTRN
jgi:hypothetical protein